MYSEKDWSKNINVYRDRDLNWIIHQVNKDINKISYFIEKLAYSNKREQLHFFTYIGMVIKKKQLVNDTWESIIDYTCFPSIPFLLSHFFMDIWSNIDENFISLFNYSNKFKIFKGFLHRNIKSKLVKYWDILEIWSYTCDVDVNIPLEIDWYSRYKFPFSEQSDKEWENFVKEVINYNKWVDGVLSPSVLYMCKKQTVHWNNIWSDIKRKSKSSFWKK